MSKFHLIWCIITQESSFERKCSSFLQAVFITRVIRCQYRTPVPFYQTPVLFTGLVRSVTGQVRSCVFSSTFIQCFERNLLTVSPIDHILLLLASWFCWDHVYAVRKCFHHLIAHRLSGILNLGHSLILTKNFIRLPFTPAPPPSGRPLDHSNMLWKEKYIQDQVVSLE
jgi:hypothetical protein